jgi:superfamily II DNA or RNA helicase
MQSLKEENQKYSVSSPESDSKEFQFRYQIAFDSKRNVFFIKVFLKEKHITRFEKFGISVLDLYNRSPVSDLHPSHRSFVQHLFRFARLDSADGYFVVPRKHVAFFLTRLSKFDSVESITSGKPIVFSKIPLSPILRLIQQDLNTLSFEASFKNDTTEEVLPFASATVFSGNRTWLLHQGIFYPLKSSEATPLLEDFNAEGKLTLTGALAADFIEELLPSLVKENEIILPLGHAVPVISRPKPEVIYSLTEDAAQDQLILSLYFSYEGHKMAPAEGETDLLFEVEENEKKRLIRRDLAFEKEILDKFYAQGFRRVGANRFETEGDQALEFVSEKLPTLKEDPFMRGEDQLNHFRIVGHLGKDQLKAVATPHGIDWFALDLGFEINELRIPLEVVRSLMAQGKHYINIPGKGFAKIHEEEISSLEEKLSELELTVDEKGRLQVPRFQAPYLDGILPIDWSRQEGFTQVLSSLGGKGEIPVRPLPENLKLILREYQHHGYDWLNFLYHHQFHGILADDMGLGKTVQVLAYLQNLKEQQGSAPNLVLAPTSVVLNWVSEAEKFTPHLKALLYTGSDRKEKKKEIDSADLVLTSFAIFRRDAEFLSERKWRTVILDEAQNIKNYRSKTALLVRELQANQRWALTGTPLENRLSELWSIFHFLMPGFLGSFAHFRRTYQEPIEKNQNIESLQRLKRRIYPFVLRRLKQEVASELPPKTEITQYCEMTAEQRKLYHEMLAASRHRILGEVERHGIDKSRLSILTALLRLRQVCCHPRLLGEAFRKKEIESGKMKGFEELLLEILSEGHRVLVFSQFVEMLSHIRSWMEEKKITYEYLDGRTRHREKHIKNFNQNEEVSVFLISLRAGGTGLNLTGADYVIHYDPWWNPAVEDQATDRAHRIGQTRHVFSYKMITKDSVEEKILSLQQRKRDLFKGVLTADSSLGKKLTVEDLEFLFS